MASPVEICNMALFNLGNTKRIANLSTERSKEAEVCRTFYETVRDGTLRDFSWGFATVTEPLALVEENPTEEWGYSYQYPTDALKILKIQSGIRNDTRQSRVSYEFEYDPTGQKILTDQQNASVKYIKKVTDTEKYPPDFVLAMAWRLAMYIAPSLTAGDPFNRSQSCYQMYNLELSRAQASALNEAQVDQDPEAESIRFRNGDPRGDSFEF